MNEPERLLRAFGADDSTLPELAAYLENPVAGKAPEFPAGEAPPEEPHVAVWREYAAEAERDGAAVALGRRFPQFLFPVAPGMSGRGDYRAATRRGEFPAGPVDGGLRLAAPDRLRLGIHDSLGGPVPVLVAPERADFVALVQALTARNEPEAVPASMGACIVSGLNNWDRVARHRRAWAAERGGEADSGEWQEEFSRLATRKPLYQDRFLLLSTGPYSAVSAADVGLDDDEWRERSLALRREHECTHLYTQRMFGAARNHALDEILADFAGLVGAFGRYRPELARRFLGVEPGGGYRMGGRLQNYRGQPPLSEAAFAVLVRVVDAAIERLARESWAIVEDESREAATRRLVARHYRRSLAALAAVDREPAEIFLRAPVLSETALDRIIDELAAFAARHRVPAGVQLDLRLVLDELLSNVRKYARKSGDPPAVEIAVRIERGEVVLELRDDGPPFDPVASPPPDTSPPLEARPIGGLGIHLVRQLTDAAAYRRESGWNVLLLRRRLARG